jgi:hypothetical protein
MQLQVVAQCLTGVQEASSDATAAAVVDRGIAVIQRICEELMRISIVMPAVRTSA